MYDFLCGNVRSHTLQASFSGPFHYELVSREELERLFGDPQGAFWKKYPNSIGYIILSRVGFNRELSQAFLYIEPVLSQESLSSSLQLLD